MDIQQQYGQTEPTVQTPPAHHSKWPLFLIVGLFVLGGMAAYVFFQSGMGGSEEPKVTDKSRHVVVYTRERHAQPGESDNFSNITELVVADVDGSNKRVVSSTDPVTGGLPARTGFISPLTEEFVYVNNIDTTSYKIMGVSLRDNTARALFEGTGFVQDVILSPNGGTIGILVEDVESLEQKNLRFITMPLKDQTQKTEIPLVVEGGNGYNKKSIVFWNTEGDFLVYGFSADGPSDKAAVFGVFDKNGVKINSPAATRGTTVGVRGLVVTDVVSPDGKWFVTSESSTDLEPVYVHSIWGPSYPQKIVVHSTEGGTDVTLDSAQNLTFERWIRGSDALIYSWGETEKGGDVRGDFTLTYDATTTEDAVTTSVNRYGVFDVGTQERHEFETRHELNEWLKVQYPDEYRYEVVYTGEVTSKLANNMTYFSQKIVAAELYVNDVLVERTQSPDMGDNGSIQVIGFAELLK